MKSTRSRLSKYLLILGTVVLTLATLGWAQNDTSSGSSGQKSSDSNASPKTASQKNEGSTASGDQPEVVKRMNNAADVLTEIMATPDKAIPDKVLSDARCIAIIPSMIKFAIGFGGNRGKGVATCRNQTGWSPPAPVTITGGSWGLQLGGQAIDLVLMVMNQKGMDDLLSAKFKLGASASATAGPVGRDAGADTDWKLKSEVLSYSRSRGLFAGVDLNGAAITQDKDDTRLLYGKLVPFKTILYGDVPAPESSHDFLSTIAKYLPNTPAPSKQGNATPGEESTTASKTQK
ncbi:MAG TPA: lipid-binding SYLF domain-containing protein [Terriglobales bacterium]|nr:lipid-binding SYLF domain-containing protein [Terriglobales bacterium]